MRKSLLFLSAAMLFVLAIYSGYASAQFLFDDEEEYDARLPLREIDLLELQMELECALQPGMTMEEFGGVSYEKMEEIRGEANEMIDQLLSEKLYEVYDYSVDLTHDHVREQAKVFATQIPKVEKALWIIIRENFTAEDIEEMEIDVFQRFGGVFGGALALENLATLRLSAEQKEKVEKIIEKNLPEYFELLGSLDVDRLKEKDETDLEAMRESLEKFILLARGGQREIELLLTDEQKQRAEELMADAPDWYYPPLNDYLKNYP